MHGKYNTFTKVCEITRCCLTFWAQFIYAVSLSAAKTVFSIRMEAVWVGYKYTQQIVVDNTWGLGRGGCGGVWVGVGGGGNANTHKCAPYYCKQLSCMWPY